MTTYEASLAIEEAERRGGVDVAPPEPRRLIVHSNGSGSTVREDIRNGLTARPKYLQPKYFYDGRGAALFEEITRTPEYYLTRVEQGLISGLADELMDQVRPAEVVELGPGSPDKISALLAAESTESHLRRYLPFDVEEGNVRLAVESLTGSHPFLEGFGIVGDFEKHLAHLPPAAGRRLIVFFGSTIGNLDPPQRTDFLLQLRRLLHAGDRFLLGLDLVKDIGTLEAAYNDAQGVTAEFNLNILRVVNRAVDSDFRPEAFRHLAFYNRDASRIEMHLVPESPQSVSLRDLDLTIDLTTDETVRTESSYKFTRASTEAMLAEAGLTLDRWYTDGADRFALALAAPIAGRPGR